MVGLAVMAHSLLGQRFARDDDKAFQKALAANLIDFPQVPILATLHCNIPFIPDILLTSCILGIAGLVGRC